MKTAIYIRKGRKVTKIGFASETFEHINAAKRRSRELQLTEDGALGRGSLVVDR